MLTLASVLERVLRSETLGRRKTPGWVVLVHGLRRTTDGHRSRGKVGLTRRRLHSAGVGVDGVNRCGQDEPSVEMMAYVSLEAVDSESTDPSRRQEHLATAPERDGIPPLPPHRRRPEVQALGRVERRVDVPYVQDESRGCRARLDERTLRLAPLDLAQHHK